MKKKRKRATVILLKEKEETTVRIVYLDCPVRIDEQVERLEVAMHDGRNPAVQRVQSL
jgi:hypothetical protein